MSSGMRHWLLMALAALTAVFLAAGSLRSAADAGVAEERALAAFDSAGHAASAVAGEAGPSS